MKFHKDILLIDFEFTHLGPSLAEPAQLGAVLLDKETLAEKDSFSSYIQCDLSRADPSILASADITEEKLKGAPAQAEVGKAFFDKFGTDVLIGFWVGNLDQVMLKKILTAAGLDHSAYDYHYFDLWPVAYFSLLKKGYGGGYRSEEMFQVFGMKPRGFHDALEDCRLEAEILRKLAAE